MTSLDETGTEYRLALLAAQARLARPRLFALYGLRHDPDGPPILGWGMEFEARAEAVLYLPDGPATHHTVSADRAMARYSCFGDMHLTWFDAVEPDEQ